MDPLFVYNIQLIINIKNVRTVVESLVLYNVIHNVCTRINFIIIIWGIINRVYVINQAQIRGGAPGAGINPKI